MIDGSYKNIDEQLKCFKKIIRKNKKLMSVLKILDEYSKSNPNFSNYYIGAGSINQTVFNYLTGRDINYGIKDFDIVYYDDDLSYEAEDKIIKDLETLLGNKNILYDIKNQARVHIWYNKKYNANRKKYISCEDAISSWGATITCVGVRLDNNRMIIYCPYGLNDIFTMTVRPIKKYFTKEQYDARASRWKAKWNELNIIEW